MRSLLMRKQALIVLGLVIVLFISINAKTAETPIDGKKVLFVANAPEGVALPEDMVMVDHLKALKLNVTIKDAKDVKPEDAEAVDLTYVAESVSSGRVAMKFNATTKPVMLSEHYITDKFGFAGAEKNTDYGQTDVKYKEVAIVAKNAKHPLAAGFKGNVAVYKENGKYSFTVPQGKAIIIATLPDDPKKAVIFAFEKGSVNNAKQKVPARRAFFYLFQGQDANQTPEGWKLFDTMLKWSLGAIK
jgi:hypothetical protein